MDVEIRRARREEAPLLTRIALESKAYWGYDAEFMERAAPLLTIDPAYIDATDVWLAEADGAPIGFYALITAPQIAVLDHLWLLPSAIGQGLGRRLFEHARSRAIGRGATRLELEAEPGAAGFYRRLGGRPVRTITTALGRSFDVYSFDLGVAGPGPASGSSADSIGGSSRSAGARSG